ncbi:DUF805 domain-containing protein [Parerythrobacter aestuarii]|uniref:DUF805 domain-containing protein n=1 Tax=Parerythrobacter aestuarii TaxID=3020909 RepID=UPI0024DE6421|nr:DUF805 domain-containing protein [Parerythrobacter aestuarii]
MLGAIRYNLANLANFSGRDSRQTFWYFMLFIIVVQFGLGMIASIPSYIEMFSNAFEAAQGGADEAEMQAAMASEMGGMMRTQMNIAVVSGLVSTVLFSAAFVRRLHDSGKPGWFLLLALVPHLGALAYSVTQIDHLVEIMQQVMSASDPGQAMAMQQQIYAYSAVGYVGYIVVAIFGIMKSDPGPNAYGEEPVRF